MVDLAGLDAVQGRLDRALALDFTELMQEGARILQEDNRDGLLAGLDCDGNPMPETWRERNPEGFWFTRGVGPGRKVIRVGGGQELGFGPPLVPRGGQSRAIANTRVGWTTAAPWHSFLSWTGFDTADGRSILGLHAVPPAGAPYPRRDVIGRPRPTAIARFRKALELFVRSVLGGQP